MSQGGSGMVMAEKSVKMIKFIIRNLMITYIERIYKSKDWTLGYRPSLMSNSLIPVYDQVLNLMNLKNEKFHMKLNYR